VSKIERLCIISPTHFKQQSPRAPRMRLGGKSFEQAVSDPAPTKARRNCEEQKFFFTETMARKRKTRDVARR